MELNSNNVVSRFNNAVEILNAIYGVKADIKLIIIMLEKCIFKLIPVMSAPIKRPAIASRPNNNTAIKRKPAGMKIQLIKDDISICSKTRLFILNNNTQAIEIIAMDVKWYQKESLTLLKKHINTEVIFLCLLPQ